MGVIVLNIALVVACSSFSLNDISWKKLDDGLFFAEVSAPIKSDIGESTITILRIDPSFYKFHLLCALEKQTDRKTAKEWVEEEDLIAVVNAGMFQLGTLKSVGFMKNFEFTINPNLNKDNTILAFNRNTPGVPEIQIIDRKCQDWQTLKSAYHSFAQGIRMIDCNQRNMWIQQERRFSIVCIAIDQLGNVLFIFSRSPYSGHDLIRNMLLLPLDLHNAMYLEGGPEASLYIDYLDFKYGNMGSYEINFNENDANDYFWDLPNVIGVTRK